MSRIRTIVCGLVILCLSSPVLCQDLAFVAGTTGIDVVLRCIQLIDNSGIFTDDNEMLRRLTFVETEDGATYANNTGGIWKINAIPFSITQTNATDYFSQVFSSFGITWQNVVYADLDKPIYSALATRLRLAVYEEESMLAIPNDVNVQYNIWSFVLHEEASPLSLSEFTSLVDQLPNATLCTGAYRDIILLVDSSRIISESDFNLVKTFLSDVVKHFDVRPQVTRIGIVQFGIEQEVPLTLNDGTSLAAVNSVISSMTRQGSSLVHIGSALNRATNEFTDGPNSRGSSDGIARVVLLLTQSGSSDSLMVPLENIATNSIAVIAVGITNGVSQAELEIIATGDGTENTISVTSYAMLADIVTNAQDTICEEPIFVSGDLSIEATIEPVLTMTYGIAIPTEGQNLTLTALSGTVSNFCSTRFKIPTSVVHDIRVNADDPMSPVFYKFTPMNSESILYCTTQATSNTNATFQFRIGNPGFFNEETTSSVTTSPSTVEATTPYQLTDGEIAGIVLACLIFIAGLVIAITYYWFCRNQFPGAANKKSITEVQPVPFLNTTKLDRITDAPSQPHETETNSTYKPSPVPSPPASLPEEPEQHRFTYYT